jgi:eukaryotic-like serine/threonine-protein kinase
MSTVDRRSQEDTAWPDDGDRGSMRDLTGVTLGDFKIEKLLGRGGMGEVYLATQLSLSRPVALKVLRPNLASNPTYLGRLRSEATAVAKLNHPNIVHVYMFGCEDQINYIAMEYVQGTNLKEYILKKGALDLPLALSIMRQTGQAIGAAGEVGLVHRDVKPENILMTKKGRVKVADFGLVRDQESDRVHLTQSGVTMGTPLYMSPEQAQGHAIDHRGDLYSLGVTYYHMLTGVPPFHAETALALALKQVREAPRSMLIHRPDLPPELDRLVLKLMEKDPANRYQSAAEMLADLAKVRDSVQVGAATAVIPDAYLAGSPARGDDSSPATLATALNARAGGSQPTTQAHATITSSMVKPVWSGLSRLSPAAVITTCVASLLIGAVPGYLARNPDVQAIPTDATAAYPALWIEPRWTAVPNQGTAEKQFRFALLQAPDDEWVPAFFAVIGYFPHAHELRSKAYGQLARIFYRQGDMRALQTLEAELSQWKDAKKRDQDLVDAVRVAIKLKQGDFGAVVQGMKTLTRDDVPDTLDPALLELSMEICADAISAADRAGNDSMRPTLRSCQSQLVRRLYKIEVPNAGRLPAAALKKISKLKTGE